MSTHFVAGTLRRAYALAVKRKLVEPTDVPAVMALLWVGQSTAYELCQDAIKERQDTLKSLALSMAARGISSRKIAARLTRAGLEVPFRTVND